MHKASATMRLSTVLFDVSRTAREWRRDHPHDPRACQQVAPLDYILIE